MKNGAYFFLCLLVDFLSVLALLRSLWKCCNLLVKTWVHLLPGVNGNDDSEAVGIISIETMVLNICGGTLFV